MSRSLQWFTYIVKASGISRLIIRQTFVTLQTNQLKILITWLNDNISLLCKILTLHVDAQSYIPRL